MPMIHVNRSGATLGIFAEEKVREGLRTGEFIGTDLGWREGMAAWRPLSELGDFLTPTAPPPPTVPAPEPVVAVVPTPMVERAGLPWENREGRSFVNALIDTLTMVFTRPDHAFSIMKREGGMGEPLIYAMIFGVVGAMISVGFSIAMNSVGLMSGRRSGMGDLLGLGASSVAVVLVIPVFLVIGLFIGAAITHVCLMIVGGANQSFETTFRVLCYASGSANALQVVPFCVGILAGLAGLIFNCIGLARAHETDTWRAVVAVLLPLVICCGGMAVLFAIFIGSLAGMNWH